MVDGRKALISYKGKEGGDHYYGENIFPIATVASTINLT